MDGDLFAFQFRSFDLQLDILYEQTVHSLGAGLIAFHEPWHPLLIVGPHFQKSLAQVFGPELYLHLVAFLHGVTAHIWQSFLCLHLDFLQAGAQRRHRIETGSFDNRDRRTMTLESAEAFAGIPKA